MVGSRNTIIGIHPQGAINAGHNAAGDQLSRMALSRGHATYAGARAKGRSTGWPIVIVVVWSASTAWQVRRARQFGLQPPTVPPVTVELQLTMRDLNSS